MSLTEELMQLVLGAPEELKREALRVLRGEPAPERRGGQRDVEGYVSHREVMEFLGVSRRSIWRWRVPCHRFGTRTRFRLSEVAAYVESAAFRQRIGDLKENNKPAVLG